MHINFLSISEVAAGKWHDIISNQGKAFAHWSGMTVSTRDRLHNSSFFPNQHTPLQFFKSTHPLSHWLCIVHQQWWEDMKNKLIPTQHPHLHQHQHQQCLQIGTLHHLCKMSGSIHNMCWVKGWQLKTRCPIEDYFNLWVLEFNKVNPCAHVVANLVSKTRPQNCQKLKNLLGKSGFSFS